MASTANQARSTVLDTTKDLYALFAQQVIATPHAVALEDADNTYSYKQLSDRVNELAQRLASYGVKRDSRVGVLLPRSASYVIACLAALQAQGAFLVLELAYPLDLLSDVIEDAQPAVVVTCKAESGKFRPDQPLIVIDDEPNTSNVKNGVHQANGDLNNGVHEAGRDAEIPADQIKYDERDLDKLAFVAYTSGTTGRPKGIANPHRAAVLSYDLRFGISNVHPGDRVAANVFFVWEILRPLFRGATVYCVADEISYDPEALVQTLVSKNITETLMTPTLLAAVLARFPDLGSRLEGLKTLWLNGEVVTTDLAKRAQGVLKHVRILNCYSTCETHEIACGDIKDMIQDDAINCPVGFPIIPEFAYVLDENHNQVAAGESGELYFGGPLLAREYLNLPETTAKAFTEDPFHPGSRMYRTGDLAVLHKDGLLEITGRTASMIKLRGYSVVPAKVEDVVVRYLGVRQCAVVAHGEGLQRELAAYIVRDPNADEKTRPSPAIDASSRSPSARKAVSSYLAEYMIPTLWVEMDQLPTHPVSGKVDLKSLPPPPKAPNGVAKVDDDPIKLKDIAKAWAAVLGIPENTIQPDHRFFDLGGHSLSLAALASSLSKRFGLEKIFIGSLAEPATLSSHLKLVREVRDGIIAEVQTNLPKILRQDSYLDRDIDPQDVNVTAVNKADTILLTGATGFLGAFLLNALLENCSARIICLVRHPNPSDAEIPACVSRLRSNLIDLGLWRDGIMERVEVLPGDLPMERLGLTPEVYGDLASRVQVILHAAASVNLVYPYASLRAANVDGTTEVLRLAAEAKSTVLYVSTNGVLPPSQSGNGWPEDAMLYVDAVPEKIPDGYGQTKWAAEQLVLEAGRRGLPVRILRAGTISGHSLSGAANAYDLLNAIFVESIHLGYYPDVEGWRAEMTPVDFVSKAIVHLGNQTKATQLVFHLGDPDPPLASTVFEHFAELGYPTKPLPFDEWIALWQTKRGQNAGGVGSFTIDILRGGLPSEGFLRDIVVLNNAQTRPFRAIVERPKVDAVLLETYCRHWWARGWLKQGPIKQAATGGAAHLSSRRSILAGRVAVITGASSGIGAAVAVALAAEGCHLVLAARRTNVLDNLKKRLVVREGKVLCVPTDVTSQTEVKTLFETAERELGPVDMVISCAGVMYFQMMANVGMEEWIRTVDVNCKGLLHVLSAVVPGMIARGQGHIVAISSDAGRKVFPGLGVYSASKFFVEGTLQALRVETASTGLRVTSIQPGNTNTDLLNMSSDKEAVEKYGTPTGAEILEPSDVANAIVYALKQPPHVSVNEILIEPREEPI